MFYDVRCHFQREIPYQRNRSQNIPFVLSRSKNHFQVFGGAFIEKELPLIIDNSL